jgi:hypothetical protein
MTNLPMPFSKTMRAAFAANAAMRAQLPSAKQASRILSRVLVCVDTERWAFPRPSVAWFQIQASREAQALATCSDCGCLADNANREVLLTA